MGKKEEFDYYYGTEAEQFSFFRIPRVLIQDPKFKQVSADAKLLYGLMLDRMSLSMKNGWLDEEKRVYIIYTLENIMEDLNCGKDKGVKILSELDTIKGIGLIERKKRGLGKPSIIYVKNFVSSSSAKKKKESERREQSIPEMNEIQSSEKPKSEGIFARSPEFGKTEVLSSENQKSGVLENRSVEFGNTEASYNKNFSYTDINQNDPINLSEVDGIDCYMDLIKENIEYDFYKRHGNVSERELVDELYQLICDVVCVKRKVITIGGDKIPYELVKSKFLKIRQPHIEYVLESMRKVSSQIHNIRAYLLTTLYYAPSTMNYYYQQEVQKDMYGVD